MMTTNEEKTWFLKEASNILTKEEILCGDVWITVEHPDYPLGIFAQIESKENDDGSYSENTFSVFGYKNIKDSAGEITTDYYESIIRFDFEDKDLEMKNKEKKNEK